ncbi:hypothetical protein [Ferrimonas pelagia]|uniref:Uncharacterized protein n=1 Tax=Ferrimonas pelagia TaxID=1177826 RepID=A0ABP9FIT5_9GAMM
MHNALPLLFTLPLLVACHSSAKSPELNASQDNCIPVNDGTIIEANLSHQQGFSNCYLINDTEIRTLDTLYEGFQNQAAAIELFGVNASGKKNFIRKETSNLYRVAAFSSLAPSHYAQIGFTITPTNYIDSDIKIRLTYESYQGAGALYIQAEHVIPSHETTSKVIITRLRQ